MINFLLVNDIEMIALEIWNLSLFVKVNWALRKTSLYKIAIKKRGLYRKLVKIKNF